MAMGKAILLIHPVVWMMWEAGCRFLVADECVMPRNARSCSGGYTYHVLNRGNAWATVFHKPADDDAFLDVMAGASIRAPLRILAYCPMPHHGTKVVLHRGPKPD